MRFLKRRRKRREQRERWVKEARGVPSGYPENLAGAARAARRKPFRRLQRELAAAGIDARRIYAEETSRERYR